MSHPLSKLHDKEEQAKISTLAFMSYNPSIGRVLEKKGVKKFEKIAWGEFSDIRTIESLNQFDDFHSKFVNEVITEIRTNRGELASYGQAQKPVNVFLKVLVDWANLPDRGIANRIRRFLHVPLDKLLMSNFKKEFPKDFENEIKPKYVKKNVLPQNIFSLSKIDKRIYWAWQKAFRRLCSDKPLLLDVMWFLNRQS